MPSLRCVDAPATASLFVHLSMHRQPLTSGVALPILDLFVPMRSRATMAPRAPSSRAYYAIPTNSLNGIRRSARYTSISRTLLPPQVASRQHPTITPLTTTVPSTRSFTNSVRRHATQALFNPQKDEDGNEMVLEITERAAKRLSEIMAKDSNPNLALRIQVESGGCHGFQYLMKLVTLPSSFPTPPVAVTEEQDTNNTSATINEDDTIFTFASADGPKALAAPKIILDLPSLELLKGSKVDFTMELIGSQFKIVDNPHATSSCGCGTSFDIKI
ncbi:hypothetical protein B0J18DRAFT_430193 [Chaetomium sp. MPI-SDFR-AT-0129]|nr:hypothetical protein B0J18DRAFT_430193 [Chaetomium sp. MPI-SDFR-AT-0129]